MVYLANSGKLTEGKKNVIWDIRAADKDKKKVKLDDALEEVAKPL